MENISRPQLASMCVFMGLRPYGSDNFLRFQLRAKLRGLKEDDQRIMWEGIDLMTKAELREACRVSERFEGEGYGGCLRYPSFMEGGAGFLAGAWHACLWLDPTRI